MATNESKTAQAQQALRSTMRDRFSALHTSLFSDPMPIEMIELFDADLSITLDEASTFLSEPEYPRKDELIRYIISTGQSLLISKMNEENDVPIDDDTKSHTDALIKICTLVQALTPTLEEQTRQDMLFLFAYAAGGRRPDMTANRETFPWDDAIRTAIRAPHESMQPNFLLRFSILRHAPTDKVTKHAQEHAQHSQSTILDILDAEFSLLDPIDYWVEKDLYDIIAAMPTGQKNMATSVLYWAMRATEISLIREKDSEIKKQAIPNDYLMQLWTAVNRQWKDLPEEHKPYMLHVDTFSLIDSIYRLAGTDTAMEHSPLGQFSETVNAIAHATTEEGQVALVSEYAEVLQILPTVEIPHVVRVWFPDIVEKIEAARPKDTTLLGKLKSRTLFKKSA